MFCCHCKRIWWLYQLQIQCIYIRRIRDVHLYACFIIFTLLDGVIYIVTTYYVVWNLKTNVGNTIVFISSFLIPCPLSLVNSPAYLKYLQFIIFNVELLATSNHMLLSYSFLNKPNDKQFYLCNVLNFFSIIEY